MRLEHRISKLEDFTISVAGGVYNTWGKK